LYHGHLEIGNLRVAAFFTTIVLGNLLEASQERRREAPVPAAGREEGDERRDFTW
jgi:hypothetical protein